MVIAVYKPNSSVHSQDRSAAGKKIEELVRTESEMIRYMIGEQLLREFILGVGDANEILSLYCKAFEVDPSLELRMVILRPFGANDFEDFFFIRNTAEQYIGKENLLLSTIISDYIFMITTILDRKKLADLLDKIRNTVRTCYKYSVVAIYSSKVSLDDMPAAFEHIKIGIGHSFYSDASVTLYEKDIKINEGDIVLRPEYGSIEHAARSGDVSKMKILISAFFKKLVSAMPTPPVAKTYCLELYVCIIRCCSVEKIDRYMKGIVYIQESRSMDDIQDYITEKAIEITEYNTPETRKVYSSLIRDTISIVGENLENENLSLRWLASNILYTNVDYLGKLFKKETGKNFSHYVMEKRMELAKELIFEGKMDRIYEVAENVGYGSNSQYFSQVFKKYTGVSPLEYKEFARLTRDNKKS